MEIDDIVFTAVFYILFAIAIGALLYVMFHNPKDRQK
jgi:hypothetical protein